MRGALRDRLLSRLKVDLSAPCTYDDAPCWVFTGVLHNGYGVIGRGRRGAGNIFTHVAAYELWYGPVPDGNDVNHLCHSADLSCTGGHGCRHRACCNPAHLEAVTHRENIGRGRAKSAHAIRTNTCKHGHNYTPENTGRDRKGNRYCKACQRNKAARRRATVHDV